MIIVTKLLQSRNIRVSYCLINICTKFTVYTVYRHSMNVDYPKIKISIGRWNEVEEIKFLLYIQRYTLFFLFCFQFFFVLFFSLTLYFYSELGSIYCQFGRVGIAKATICLDSIYFYSATLQHNSSAMQKLLQRLEAFSPSYDPQFRFDFENSELIKQRTTIKYAR